MARPFIYSQDYIQECFNEWYLHGRPSSPSTIRSIIPAPPNGIRTPSTKTITRWIIEGTWDLRADELDAQVSLKNDKNLINKKAKMLREQQSKVGQVVEKSLSHLMADGFDSSSAAVNAFYKGLELMRNLEGFSDLLEKLDKLTNNDVENLIVDLVNRASDNDQIIDSEEILGIEDGEEKNA